MTASILHAQQFLNLTGTLRVWDLPWPAVREFEIRGVPPDASRGNHAHKTCDQIIRCSAGQFMLTTQTSDKSIRAWPMTPGFAILVPRMNWIVLNEFSKDAVVTVLCSEEYKPPITDFEEFLRESHNVPVS